jgi:cardiolipin synthase (CMP-forming)
MNVPNIITIGRMLLVPFTVWCLITGQYGLAFAAFVAAGVSDGVDGYLARRYNWQTELGAYLDPLADKALLVSIYVVLAILKVIPVWLAIVVVTRDVLIVGAVILSWLMERPVVMKPLLVSKVNTVGQIAFAGLMLGLLALRLPHANITDIGTVIVASLTVASLGVYMRDWLRHMNAPLGQDKQI